MGKTVLYVRSPNPQLRAVLYKALVKEHNKKLSWWTRFKNWIMGKKNADNIIVK